MNVHKNARQTPRGRAIMIDRIEHGWSVARTAEAAGVSARTGYRWLDRHRRGERLCDRSSAPRHCPHRIAAERMDEIERLRRERMTGPAIAAALGMARSTVGLALRRLGLGKLKLLDPRPPVIRYEHAAPGDMIHLDIKKLGRFAAAGHRVTGDRQLGRSKRVGWDFLHVCVDDASRLAYTEVLPSEGQADTTAFLERALAWLQRLGITVERVMTDNGSAYRSRRFAAALGRAGLRHVRTRPYTPRTNGKAERGSTTASGFSDYQRRLYASLARGSRYPAEARYLHLAGVTQLAFRIDRSGTVLESWIRESSGSELLDSAALEALTSPSLSLSLYALSRLLAALIITADNAMMVSPSQRPASCHQKYHQIAGMQWYFADLTETTIPQKTAETAIYGTFWHALGRHFGDPYGNRTRASAVKGPRPNR